MENESGIHEKRLGAFDFSADFQAKVKKRAANALEEKSPSRPIKMPGVFSDINHPRTQMFIILFDLRQQCEDILKMFQKHLRPPLIKWEIVANFNMKFQDGVGSELIPQMGELLIRLLGWENTDMPIKIMERKIEQFHERLSYLIGRKEWNNYELFRPLKIELADGTSHIITNFNPENVANTLPLTRNRSHIYDVCGSLEYFLQELLDGVHTFLRSPKRRPNRITLVSNLYEKSMQETLNRLDEFYTWLWRNVDESDVNPALAA